MIGFETVLIQIRGLEETRLRAWIDEGWVRPAQENGQPVFEEIDLARCRLILELQEELEVNDAAMPVVLHLLDRLHATRRQLRRLAEALDRARGAPHER
ncbi:chaperone modulator CbpM [Muricoccus aerilatus]|uniref:chaperone modulator CbpM n=1 Tax=Muricoccus aerilatus TaxID=452982 RepID=UPI0005C1EF9B|nr:chaperone modulator CbpM [Roseomonas aerilata]